MIELAIMIEGQNGLNWPRWQRLVTAVEDLGFAGLYRSDHYTNASPYASARNSGGILVEGQGFGHRAVLLHPLVGDLVIPFHALNGITEPDQTNRVGKAEQPAENKRRKGVSLPFPQSKKG